jgi:hypothetical protein
MMLEMLTQRVRVLPRDRDALLVLLGGAISFGTS